MSCAQTAIELKPTRKKIDMFIEFTSDEKYVLKVLEEINQFHTEYSSYKAMLVKPKDPTSTELSDWVKENEPKVFTAFQKAIEKAKTALTPNATMDVTESAKIREQYTIVRKRLNESLKALQGYGDVMGLTDVSTVAGNALGTLTAPTTTPKNSETALIREWAKANGVDVAAKGRIPQTIVDQYNAR